MYILTHVFVIKEGGSHEKKDKLYIRKETGTDDDTRNRNYVFIQGSFSYHTAFGIIKAFCPIHVQ